MTRNRLKRWAFLQSAGARPLAAIGSCMTGFALLAGCASPGGGSFATGPHQPEGKARNVILFVGDGVVVNNQAGVPEREPDLAKDGLPYTTLGYLNGPGAVTTLSRPDITNVDTEDEDYRQQALIPMSSESHGGEDVAIYAKGPGAFRSRGVLEQNVIFDIMRIALGFGDE